MSNANHSKPSPAKPRRGALPIGESGMRTLAVQISELLGRADVSAMAADLDLAMYTRLAVVLVRLVEAGVKCEKHRSDEKRGKQVKGPLEQASLKDFEERLNLM